jgi:hypothetical protein
MEKVFDVTLLKKEVSLLFIFSYFFILRTVERMEKVTVLMEHFYLSFLFTVIIYFLYHNW